METPLYPRPKNTVAWDDPEAKARYHREYFLANKSIIKAKHGVYNGLHKKAQWSKNRYLTLAFTPISIDEKVESRRTLNMAKSLERYRLTLTQMYPDADKVIKIVEQLIGKGITNDDSVVSNIINQVSLLAISGAIASQDDPRDFILEDIDEVMKTVI